MTGQSGSGQVGSDNMRMFGSGQKNPGGIHHQPDEKGLQAMCEFCGVVMQEKVDFFIQRHWDGSSPRVYTKLSIITNKLLSQANLYRQRFWLRTALKETLSSENGVCKISVLVAKNCKIPHSLF